MTKTSLPALAIAVSFLLPAVAEMQADITGAWEMKFETPQGPATIEVIFNQVGESVDGTVATPMGAFDFTGALINNDLSMSAAVELPGHKLDVALKGKVSGDLMTGNLVVGDLREIPLTAKRRAAAPADNPKLPPASGVPEISDVSGKWDIDISMGGAAFSTIMTLKQAGEQITGTIGGQAGEEPVTGTIVGRAVTLNFRAATPQGDAAITMKGALGADGLSGKVTIAPIGEVDWKGTRSVPK